MNGTPSTLRYPGFRFPAEITGHAEWLNRQFAPSFRDIEDLLAESGIIMTRETIRQWCRRFGRDYTNPIRRRGSNRATNGYPFGRGAAGIFGCSTPLWLKPLPRFLLACCPIPWRPFVAQLRGTIPQLRENVGEPRRWIDVV